MRRGLSIPMLSVLLVAPAGLLAQSSPVTSVEKVIEGVWMAKTDKGSNVSWFLLGDEVIAIDTGSDSATGKAALQKIQETAGKPVRYVVITHAHGDHAGGVVPFVEAGAQVICHENAAPAIAALLQASSRPRTTLITLSERLSFVGGPRRAAIYYPGPAHTRGDLIVFLPDEKVLFSGDLALPARAPYMQSPDVDPKGWEKALERLAGIDIDKVVPGHGEVGTRQALADTFGYVKKVNELAQKMLDEKVSEEMIEARLRRPNSGIEEAAITPELIGNIRGVMRSEKAKTSVTPTPAEKTPKATEKKKS